LQLFGCKYIRNCLVSQSKFQDFFSALKMRGILPLNSLACSIEICLLLWIWYRRWVRSHSVAPEGNLL
jgi:hypothetical protein